MGKFLRGLLIGIGIAMLIAPKRGQEQRRILSERIQQIRGYLSRRVQSNPTLQQGADRVTQAVTQAKETAQNTAAQAVTQVKETAQNVTQQAVTQVKETAQNVTQQAVQVKNTAQNTLNRASTQAQETTKNATEQITGQRAASNGDNAASNVADAAQQSAVQVKQSAQAALSSTTTSAKNAASTLQATGLNTPLSAIPGIEPEPQGRLEALGIHTTGQLLEQTATKEMRTDLAQRIGISAHMLRTLVDRADLLRLPSIGREMATLLEEAGVNGCKDLQHRNPEHLYATLIGTQEGNKSASLTPNLDELTQWIAEAKAETHSAR